MTADCRAACLAATGRGRAVVYRADGRGPYVATYDVARPTLAVWAALRAQYGPGAVITLHDSH